MSIFKALTSFGHRLPEDNYSDYLAYLLNPHENYNLNSEILSLFIKKVFDEKIEGNNYNNISIYREKQYGRRYIDIEIDDIYNNNYEYKKCIECKTSGSHADRQQIQDEYNSVRNSINDKNIRIIFIYLTPLHCEYYNAINDLCINNSDSKIWMTWNRNNDHGFLNENNIPEVTSILDILKESKSKEKDILRYFINHLESEFNIRDTIRKQINGTTYEIIRYFDNSVYLKIGNNIILNNEKLEKFRIINTELFGGNLQFVNTQQAAKLVLNMLRNM